MLFGTIPWKLVTPKPMNDQMLMEAIQKGSGEDLFFPKEVEVAEEVKDLLRNQTGDLGTKKPKSIPP